MFYYSTAFFEDAGMDADTAKYGTIGAGAVNVLATMLAVYLIDRLGRKVSVVVKWRCLFHSFYLICSRYYSGALVAC